VVKFQRRRINFMRAKRNRCSAFTLVELLMVCAIIMILAGIGIGIFAVAIRKTNESKAEAMIKKMCIALEAYKDKTGYYFQWATVSALYIDNPSLNDDINDFLDIPDSELDAAVGIGRGAWMDPFGNQFWYQCPGSNNRGSFDLRSRGSDTTTTVDDIKNW
jgi:type II secretory pathway pseudopilin PulG